ncbi:MULTISPECIES: DUF742 domain-containing protein [Streptomyces]|uniref:DUF742 domain-containing protein n=4 Tax=Streptomyces TaxID=1883 RepID=A0ABV4ZFX3_9ACTN|nr:MULTISPECIES: DUF742 domain-containing protein [Streptomyces]MCK1817983.1 DUF742 domain-containing protein [Streptomyces sp. XM4011]UWM51530.1 DUF742 domain-containing protein [Streptomyces carpaticus]
MTTPPGGPYGNDYPAQPHSGGQSGRFNFPSAPSGGHRRTAPEQRAEAAPPQRQPQPEQPRRRSFDSEPQPLVRPYAMTGGRTRPRYQLAIEALVSTSADPAQLGGQLPEHQRICQLCYEVKSVAEVSALLSIPLGVTRILVADLAEAGLVAIHQPGHEGEPGGQPDVTLLERVLSGLRKL